ncbi:MAG: type I-MYXAN CRISPR-associated endonuclease Cas1 [Spirochaetota bacterium]
MGLHSISYCERLFYLEEVEGILIADERVYAGRTLHEEIQVDNADIQRVETFEHTSTVLGLTGKADRLQKRDGNWIPYEHKTGRSKSDGKDATAWEADKIQVIAYAILLEEQSGRTIEEARVKYHRDNKLVKIPITEELRQAVLQKLERAKELHLQQERPPVAENPNLCIKCSLASVCLPEENRVVSERNYTPIRLFPPAREKQTIHVSGYATQIKKYGDTLIIDKKNASGEWQKSKVAVNDVESLSLHGTVQISTQLLHYLSYQNIPIHYFSGGGNYIASVNKSANSVQRKLRQYSALQDDAFCLYLTKRLAMSKCESQLKYMLRTSRENRRSEQVDAIAKVRSYLAALANCQSVDEIRGYEGLIARKYHGNTPFLLKETVPPEMIPKGRSKRPPKDRYNAIQSFLYALLYRSVLQAIVAVGLEPAISFYHTPRTNADPLVLDVMELFRVVLCDIPLVGSVNRLSWHTKDDFLVSREKVWLSDSGRKKAIRLYEERLEDKWKHPVTDYSLSYYRMIELEVRLLEKEWTDKKGLFAKARLR